MTTSAVILACIASEQPMTVIYQDAQGMISVRVVVPSSVERCANGNTILRCFDTHRKAPRSLTLHRIQKAIAASETDVRVTIQPVSSQATVDDVLGVVWNRAAAVAREYRPGE